VLGYLLPSREAGLDSYETERIILFGRLSDAAQPSDVIFLEILILSRS
jgi:hypothetical protein